MLQHSSWADVSTAKWSADGPERNNSLLYCHLPSPSFFIFLPSPNPVRYKTNSVAVKKCAGSFFCWCLLTSESREFGYLQKFRLWLLEICTLWFLSLPLYVLDVHTAADELEGGDVVLCFRLAIYETEFKGTEYFGHTCEYSYVNVCLCCSKQRFYWGFWRVLSVADSASGQNQNAGFAKVLKAWEMKPQAMVPFNGRNWGDSHISRVTLLLWKVMEGRGAFARYMFQWLNSMWDS